MYRVICRWALLILQAVLNVCVVLVGFLIQYDHDDGTKRGVLEIFIAVCKCEVIPDSDLNIASMRSPKQSACLTFGGI